jgi:hypothetical protein
MLHLHFLRLKLKQLLVLIVLLLAGKPVFAQEGRKEFPANKTAFWGTLGLGGSFGSHARLAAQAALTAVQPNDWGLSAAIHYTQRNARNTPSDYIKYTGGFNWGGPNQPQDDFTTYSLSVVRRRQPSRGGKGINWILEAGPALVRIQEQHFLLIPHLDEYDSNYETVQRPHFVPGLHAAAGVTGAPFGLFGMGVQAWTNINPVTPLIGLDFQILFGRLR